MEIDYQPIKKIILHDIQKYSIEDFIELHCGGGSVGWCNGVIYSVGHFHQIDSLVEEKLQGIEHWQVLDYAEMNDYKPTVTTNNNLECIVINQSNHPKIADVVKFATENYHE